MELFYNPERMSEQEIKETFVAHQWLVDEIVSILKRQPKGAGVQHVVIVAPRGMGKTTLLLMLRFAVLNTEIAKRWQPVLFPEESYGVYDLADLWVEFLNHIASETGDAALRDEVLELRLSHPSSDDLEAVALAKIKDWRKKNNKRLLMLLDNFDMILAQIGDEKDNASLRDFLMNDGTLMLVGGSTTFFKEARAYDQPLYNLFKIYNLDGLDSEQIEELLRRRAKLDGLENFEEILRANRTRLRVLEYFTGGNPRLVLMLYRVITHSQISDVRRGLEKLLDEVTPYYKAKIEALPPQQRKILDQIARITGQTREGLTPTEIAPATRLPINHVSAQLKRLADVGYVRIANIRGRSSYYTLAEPLYAIWHQMRFSRETRKRMNWLIDFLKGWYDAKELGAECKRLDDIFRNYLDAGREEEAREALEYRRYLMEAIEDQISRARTFESIVLGYLELRDVDTLKGELLADTNPSFLSEDTRQRLVAAGLLTGDWARLSMADDTAVSSEKLAKVVASIERAIAALKDGNKAGAAELLTALESQFPKDSSWQFLIRAQLALIGNNLDDCLSNFEMALQKEPNLAPAWYMKGIALSVARRLEEAAEAFKRVVELYPDFDSWLRLAEVLKDLGQHEEAIASFDNALQLQPKSFEAQYGRAISLAFLGRMDEALASMDRVLSLRPDSAKSWSNRGIFLVKSGSTEEAVKSVDRAIELKPDSDNFLVIKAIMLQGLNKTEEALQTVNWALKVNPRSSDAYFVKGVLLISTDSNQSLSDFKHAFDLKSDSYRTLVNTTYGKLIKTVLSLLNQELDMVRSDWKECIRHATEQDDQAVLLKQAPPLITAIAKTGRWDLAKEMIESANLEEPLFPLARALDYLLEGDETLIEKLSPEVRRIVDEIVTTLRQPSVDNKGKKNGKIAAGKPKVPRKNR